MNTDQPTRDLWGDLTSDGQGPQETEWPYTLLAEQADLLAQKTNNLLLARSEIRTFRGGRAWRFFIIAPALDNYRYELFRVEQGFAKADTLRVFELDSHGSPEDVPTSEFENHIQKILSSPATKSVIASLLLEIKQRQEDIAEQG